MRSHSIILAACAAYIGVIMNIISTIFGTRRLYPRIRWLCAALLAAVAFAACDNPMVVTEVFPLSITPPHKTVYEIGEAFETAGLEVYVSYGSHLAPVQNYTLTLNGNPIENGNLIPLPGAYIVTVSVTDAAYGTRTSSFRILVFGASNLTIANTSQWNAALSQIRDRGDYQNYTITVSGNVPVPGSAANSFGTVSNITVTLQGNGKLYLTSQGNMIRLGDNQTLIIDGSGLTLEGLTNGINGATQDNNTTVVYLNNGTAKLELHDGAITSNIASYGGGVHVGVGGSFTMSGGEISGNTVSSFGGGVYVGGGSFTMSGGEIFGNTASYGGGVDVGSSSYFTMSGTFVSSDGSFTMSGGDISGNTASSSYHGGGGVSVSSGGSFTMSGGEISGNTASSYGGGVCVDFWVIGTYGAFTMSGGKISGNTSSYGGGVYVNGGSFMMSGGEISGNTASSYGGGVYVDRNSFVAEEGGTFAKTDGTIYGYSAYDMVNSNVVKNNSGVVQNYKGHAVYARTFDLVKIREGTAGPGDNLSFNSRTDPPTASGAWDN